MERISFEMTEADLATLMDACKPVKLIATHCGPIQSPQEKANAAWKALGDKMGFDHMTVQPIGGKGERFFTAESTATIETTVPELTMPSESKATEIPIDDCGITINVGLDGTWMHYAASNGKYLSINMENAAKEADHFNKGALQSWCADRRKQAKIIRSATNQGDELYHVLTGK